MKTNGNEPAFPRERMAKGLSKREYISIVAMQGLLHSSSMTKELIAQESVRYADALLSELEKGAVEERKTP